ncbi:carnitine O-acetyltransferase-like [Sinocyclocheilus rhinocerous]|uniref:carnitine O-acetyltransferase-like n=1 Tax=Sinocyclocheilus rhinocerous TaxID=307959 RepID=UPI0007BA216C|nr:PREDICTED: carnitine O-acetyltransferase-like [Sinocyclocheilus rhinocerous]
MILERIPPRICSLFMLKATLRQAHSSSVRPQPVPPLLQTLQRYLTALEPLLPPEELEHTRGIVQKFGCPGGLGENLQRELIKRAKHSHNWISDWWVQWAYLECRQPLAVHSNPAISLPKRDFTDWRGQLVFASKLIAGVLDFKAQVDSGRLGVEYMRGQPLCMELFPQLFSSCRIPGPKHDHVIHYGRPRRGPAHITVVRNYQFFQLDVYNSDGTPLTESQIHAQLLRIRSQSWKTDKQPMGILTSEHRHTWGQAYTRLLRDKINKESVRLIEKSIFTLCLDSPVMRISDEKYSSRMAAQILHGGGTFSNSGNRWFDKTLQFVVGEDGSWGLLYEHATAEGPPIATLLDHVLDYCKKPDRMRAPLIPLPMPKKLYFYINSEIKWDLEMAKQNLDMWRFSWPTTGEACRKRSGIIQKRQMIKREAKVQLLREAVDAYSILTEQSLMGQGIDRHLLGLKLQAIEEGLSVPRIFMDTAYGLATHWKLRTGQVPANTDSVMCFGPLVPDGYAVCYNPQQDHVHFSITAFNCCEETNAEKLALTLERSLHDLQELFQPTV